MSKNVILMNYLKTYSKSKHTRKDFAGPKTLREFWDSRPGPNKLKVKHWLDPVGQIVNDG